jgi:hypothetical protein
MTQEDSAGPIDQAQVLQTTGAALVSSAPEDWHQLRYEFSATVQIDGSKFESVTSDGTVTRVHTPSSVPEQFDELRSAMYQPGKGTWFTARYVIERSGQYKVDFDYDNEPDFVPQLTASAYALDLEYFPRGDEHIPEWLRDKLREART